MKISYNILRKLGNGEKLLIASLFDREQAEQLAQSFDEQWPAIYEIHEAQPLGLASGPAIFSL
jgi:hypothetical protein